MVARSIYAVVDAETFAGFCEVARREGIVTKDGKVDLDAALAGICKAYAEGRLRVAMPGRREVHAKPTGVDYRKEVGHGG